MLIESLRARWSPRLLYPALASLRDSHPLATRHSRKSVLYTGHWWPSFLDFHTSSSTLGFHTSAFSTCHVWPVLHTNNDIGLIFRCHSKHKHHLCLNPCSVNSASLPKVKRDIERQIPPSTPPNIYYSCLFTRAMTVTKQQLVVILACEVVRCIISHELE